MVAEEKIEGLTPYRELRSIKEGSVFAKYKIKKKPQKTKEKSEKESTPPKRESSDHKIDIEA